MLITVGGESEVPRRNPHTLHIRAQEVSDFAGRVDEWLPYTATLRAIAMGLGITPTSAVAVPRIDWNVSRVSVRDDAGRRVLPQHLKRADAEALHFRRAEAIDRVDEVKALYGLMLSDIAYRIENSALFDSSMPTTRAFDTAMAIWADITDGTPDVEVLRLSAIVKVQFDTARAHAETVGLAHLPLTARDDAGRAAKAARLAARAGSEAERTAAQKQVVRILSSLALYYLPDPGVYSRALPG